MSWCCTVSRHLRHPCDMHGDQAMAELAQLKQYDAARAVSALLLVLRYYKTCSQFN
jgi:hypothetical protein